MPLLFLFDSQKVFGFKELSALHMELEEVSMSKNWILFVLFSVCLCMAGCAVPLKEYVPSSENGREIKSVLVRYEDCWNTRNAECLMNLSTEDFEMRVPGRGKKRFISRSEAPDDFLPRLFERYGTANYRLAKMDVEDGSAHVILYVDFSKLPLITPEVHLIMVRHKEKWLIKRQYHTDIFSSSVPKYTFY